MSAAKVYYASELTDAELFVLLMLRAFADGKKAEALAKREGRDPAEARESDANVMDFRRKFLLTFHVDFQRASLATWAPIYRKGIEALKDRGLIEELSIEPSTGLWAPAVVHFERVEDSAVIWSERQ